MNREFAERSWPGYIAVVVWCFGGVSGLTRGIVYHWPGEFTAAQVRRSFHLLYRGLNPGEFQIEDCIERMVWERRVKCVGHTANGENLYRVCEREPFFRRSSPKQMKFEFAVQV